MFSQTSSLNISVQRNYFNGTPSLHFKLLKVRREQIFRLKKAFKIRFLDSLFPRPIDNKCQNAICVLTSSQRWVLQKNLIRVAIQISDHYTMNASSSSKVFAVEICRIKGSVSSGFFLKKLESNTCHKQNQNPAKHL